MSKIHDPKFDGLFKNGAAAQPTVITAMNDLQLVAIVSAIVGASSPGETTPNQAVLTAINLIAESAVHLGGGGLQRAVNAAQQKAVRESDAILSGH